jgi:hypothetical protein
MVARVVPSQTCATALEPGWRAFERSDSGSSGEPETACRAAVLAGRRPRLGQSRKGVAVYIGIGTIVLIILIILVIMFLRRV